MRGGCVLATQSDVTMRDDDAMMINDDRVNHVEQLSTGSRAHVDKPVDNCEIAAPSVHFCA
jgi:hypothetical protein